MRFEDDFRLRTKCYQNITITWYYKIEILISNDQMIYLKQIIFRFAHNAQFLFGMDAFEVSFWKVNTRKMSMLRVDSAT